MDTARPLPVTGLLAAGLTLGLLADGLLRFAGPPGLNFFIWIASVALAALVLHRRAGLALDRERAIWLAIGVSCAAGLAWRDAPPLKFLAMGATTLALALAAYRPVAAWVHRAGVTRYGRAWATGAFHAWTASALVVLEVLRPARRNGVGAAGWRRAGAIARGLLIAAPLVAIFGALFMSADAVFSDLVLRIVRVDVDIDVVVSHIALFGVSAWIAAGYLRGFLTGTELPPLRALWRDGAPLGFTPKRLSLGITEVATALAAIDVLFLAFVIVQFRYLFGGDALVQVTPDLTYAEYARRGFFELVLASALVVPVLLSADWLLERSSDRDEKVFRALAGTQIALVLAIAASAFDRLRLYYVGYGLTEARMFAMVLLIWIGAMLIWLPATVLRGRRDLFAFGALVAGFSTLAVLFVVNPDAIVARANLARLSSPDSAVRFDVAYATSLSADAVPVLIGALPGLPADVQCPLARHMLRSWGPDQERSVRNWNWAASSASRAVDDHLEQLQAMVGPTKACAAPAK